MTDTAENAPVSVSTENGGRPEAEGGRRRKGTGLDAMLLPELKRLASSMGLKGTGAMRKGDLIAAIRSAQSSSGGASAKQSDAPAKQQDTSTHQQDAPAKQQDTPAKQQDAPAKQQDAPTQRDDAGEANGRTVSADVAAAVGERLEREVRPADREDDGGRQDNGRHDGGRQDGGRQDGGRQDNRRDGNRQRNDRGDSRNDRGGNDNRNDRNDSRNDNRNDSRNDGDDGGGRRGRRRRNRDRQGRRNRGGGERMDSEPTFNDDDVLVPVSGILDVLDNYAFVRRSGYLSGSEDAYVSLSLVKKFGLRRGDVVTGVLRAPRDGERREKFNPLVRVETVNGRSPEEAKDRADFSKLTPLYPQDRLRMETTPNKMTGRIIDLIAPIGKGQRGLIVSPSKAGKTLVMQNIANAITTNNPEVHLMVVLVDERPEEVTDFERTVTGEVISSTFDRPASDHTAVAELAIERAKRLVELGHDVVVLLDGITRLGRAYNLAAPASGRILSGGVDSAALYPPKRFFGAARNIEDGGSLTILATALIESGSKMDEVIFEEFKGTGNMELRLRREFADRRIFPAIDVDSSSTRREELLLGKEELAIIWKLRRVLGGLDGQQALEMLLDRLRKTQSNTEFLVAISRNTPGREE